MRLCFYVIPWFVRPLPERCRHADLGIKSPPVGLPALLFKVIEGADRSLEHPVAVCRTSQRPALSDALKRIPIGVVCIKKTPAVRDKLVYPHVSRLISIDLPVRTMLGTVYYGCTHGPRQRT